MKKKITAAAVFVALVFGGAYYINAQMGGGGPRQGGGQGGMMMPGGMGGGAMVVYGKYIYVLNGPVLTQVDPVQMKVIRELNLRGGARPQGSMKGVGGAMPGSGDDE